MGSRKTSCDGLAKKRFNLLREKQQGRLNSVKVYVTASQAHFISKQFSSHFNANVVIYDYQVLIRLENCQQIDSRVVNCDWRLFIRLAKLLNRPIGEQAGNNWKKLPTFWLQSLEL